MPASEQPLSPVVSALTDQAAYHATRAKAHVIRGCQHALQCGMRLIWIHAHTALPPNGSRVSHETRSGEGSRVSHETRSGEGSRVSHETPGDGFAKALKRINIPRPTAYRWINAAAHALATAGFDPAELPMPASRAWRDAQRALDRIGAGTSLRRLSLGFAAEGSDPHRAEDLIARAEAGDELADSYIEKVEKGEMTWVQAIRAAAGAQATQGKERRDPVYLDIDPATGRPHGLFPRALVTLRNAFARWDDLPQPVRKQARELWLETVSALPAEFRSGPSSSTRA